MSTAWPPGAGRVVEGRLPGDDVTDLPAWVYDAVIEMQRWADYHPKLHAEFYDQAAGQHRMQPVDDCGCKAYALVPDEVKTQARALAAYLERQDDNKAEVDRLNVEVERLRVALSLAEKQRADVVGILGERSKLLADALGLEKQLQYEYMAEQVEKLRQETP